MANDIYTYDTLDIDLKSSSRVSVKCKQLDDIVLNFDIYNDGAIENIENYNVELRVVKPDNKFVIQSKDIMKKGNNIKIECIQDITREKGRAKGELRFVNKNNKQKTSFDVIIDIKPGVLDGSEGESQNVITIIEELDTAIDEARKIIEDLGDDIEKIVSTGNNDYNVTTGMWVSNTDASIEALYKYNINHGMGSENLQVEVKDATTKMSVLATYKIIDKMNLMMYSNVKVALNVVISASYYNGSQEVSVRDEVIDARIGQKSLGDKIRLIDASMEEKVFYTDTVTTMKLGNYKVGDVVITLGFRTINDGGNGEYIIKNDIIADGYIVHTLNNQLKAELIIKNKELDLLQIGLYGDGKTDNLYGINIAITLCSNKKLTLSIKNGDFYTTKKVVFKSNMDIVCSNSKILVNVEEQYAGSIYSLTELKISGMKLTRIGDVTMDTYCMVLALAGDTDETVILNDCVITNEVKPINNITSITGIQITDNAKPTLVRCNSIVKNKDVGKSRYCSGMRIGGLTGSACSPTLIDCVGKGGTGLGSIGIVVDNMIGNHLVKMSGCVGYGGIGEQTHGITLDDISNAELCNCKGYGGTGQGACGLVAFAGVNLIDNNGIYTGGNSSGGSHCCGVRVNNSEPIFNGTTAYNGICGSAGHSFYITDLGNPTFNNCKGEVQVDTFRGYNRNNENVQIVLSNTSLNRIRTIDIQLYIKHETATLNIGTTPGGNEIAENISMNPETEWINVTLKTGAKKILSKSAKIYVSSSILLPEYSYVIVGSYYRGGNAQFSVMCNSERGFTSNNSNFKSVPFSNSATIRIENAMEYIKMNNTSLKALPSESGEGLDIWFYTPIIDNNLKYCVYGRTKQI